MKSVSKRLEKIASFVNKGSFIADIGSDHCLLPIFLLDKGNIVGAQAVENKEGPYKRTVQAIKNNGYENLITASLSDGIEELDPRADTVVLAGMGGFLISNIINSHKEKLSNVHTVIVDAHKDIEEVYKTLSGLSFALSESCFLFDKGKPYDVMKWVKSDHKIEYTDMEKRYGYFNIRRPNDEFKTYYRHVMEVLEKIKEKTKDNPDRLEEINYQINEILSIL